MEDAAKSSRNGASATGRSGRQARFAGAWLDATLTPARCAAPSDARLAEAEARAEELARANTALQKGLAFFAFGEDIDAFLRHQLKVIADQFGSTAAALWVDGPEAGVTRLLYSLEDGEVLSAAESRHPLARTVQSTHESVDLELRSQRKPVLWPTEIYRDPAKPFFDPAVADRLEAAGCRALFMLPLIAGDRVIGAFIHRLPSADPLPPARLELAQALANQAALALHLSRLAAAEREAAVAKEREAAAEQRAAVLARANAALGRSVATLSTEGDLDAYLGGLLLILLEQMEAASGTLWWVEDGWHHLRLEVVDGHILSRDQSAHPGARRPVSTAKGGNLSAQASYRQQSVERRPSYYPDVATEPAYDGDEEMRAYLLSLGVRAQLVVPLFSGDRHLGTFAIRSPEPRAWTADQIELAEALANQAALAIELDRLAAEAREMAVAKEREAAAERRAETLARANAAIRTSLDRLAEGQDLDAFLGEVVQVCAREFDAVGVGVWLRPPGEPNFTDLVLSYEDGEIRPAGRFANPAVRAPADPDSVPLQRGEIAIQSGENLRSRPWYAAFRDYLESRGIVAIASVPLFLGDRWAGAIVLRFTREPDLTGETAELAHALANQVALALDLTRLADAAREAALDRERNTIARELHDTLAQGFAAIAMQLQAAERAAGGALPSAVTAPLALARRLARENMTDARRSVGVLRTRGRDSLSNALARLVDSSRRGTSTLIALTIAPEVVDPPPGVAHELLRIAQEGLNNALRHGGGAPVTVSLSAFEGAGVRLSVADDGVGFDPAAETLGFGLRGLQERADEIGAALTLISEPGRGAQLVVSWSASAASVDAAGVERERP